MKNSIEIKKELDSEQLDLSNLQNEKYRILKLIKEKETAIVDKSTELAKVEEIERTQKEKNYIKSAFGVEEVTNNIYIIFTKKAEFIKILKLKEDFEYMSDLEDWLKKEKLYAHALSSFIGRHSDWYDWPLIKQLENLEWKVNKKGTQLIGLDW